ncbi:hypothetical protein, partial [Brevibacterium sandarakinum]|uniref:hypothetical protein n=1 Tax=Brevibacterium sandarakinum TaxID=629680 RepID=UPI002654B933
AERALADVHERDETVARLEGRLIEAEKSRRLTADDITDGMMARGLSAYWGQYQNGNDEEVVRDILASALTEPQRPEGAEDIKPEIQSWLRSATGGVGALTPERVERLADFLAERGVRVVTEEQP